MLSRGNAVPPISRLEERNQSRWCSRLRRKLAASLARVKSALIHEYETTKAIAEEGDLEKFLEVYDADEVNLHELDDHVGSLESDGMDVLKSLKASLVRMYIIRKLLLCCLLAVPSFGGGQDFVPWQQAVGAIENVSSLMGDEAQKLQEALLRDEGSFARAVCLGGSY